jgi:hypothetical protein
MAKLRGQALLQYLKENAGADERVLIEGAGYSTTRSGKLSLQRTDFYRAVGDANGLAIGSFSADNSGGNGKEATYLLKVGPKGLVPVGRAYTTQCGMKPGDFVKVIIEDGVIILEPQPEAASCPPTPPVAQLCSVA